MFASVTPSGCMSFRVKENEAFAVVSWLKKLPPEVYTAGHISIALTEPYPGDPSTDHSRNVSALELALSEIYEKSVTIERPKTSASDENLQSEFPTDGQGAPDAPVIETPKCVACGDTGKNSKGGACPACAEGPVKEAPKEEPKPAAKKKRRKRRTKAEIEAEKAAKEAEKNPAPAPAAIERKEEDHGVEIERQEAIAALEAFGIPVAKGMRIGEIKELLATAQDNINNGLNPATGMPDEDAADFANKKGAVAYPFDPANVTVEDCKGVLDELVQHLKGNNELLCHIIKRDYGTLNISTELTPEQVQALHRQMYTLSQEKDVPRAVELEAQKGGE